MLILLVLPLALFLLGCQRGNPQPSTQPSTVPTATLTTQLSTQPSTLPADAAYQPGDFAADQVTISALLSSYLLMSDNEDLVAELAASYQSCRFVATTQEIDLGSLYEVTFFKDQQIIAKLSLDPRGICRIEGKPGLYTLSSGQLQYDRLAQIFTESRQSAMAGSP
jgi:hypothetical protein